MFECTGSIALDRQDSLRTSFAVWLQGRLLWNEHLRGAASWGLPAIMQESSGPEILIHLPEIQGEC